MSCYRNTEWNNQIVVGNIDRYLNTRSDQSAVPAIPILPQYPVGSTCRYCVTKNEYGLRSDIVRLMGGMGYDNSMHNIKLISHIKFKVIDQYVMLNDPWNLPYGRLA